MSARAEPSPRHGVTLVELIAALAIVGVALGVAGMAFGARGTAAGQRDAVAERIADARAAALRGGSAVSVTVTVDGRETSVTALPDGSVIADATVAVDRLTGRMRAEK